MFNQSKEASTKPLNTTTKDQSLNVTTNLRATPSISMTPTSSNINTADTEMTDANAMPVIPSAANCPNMTGGVNHLGAAPSTSMTPTASSINAADTEMTVSSEIPFILAAGFCPLHQD